MNDEKLWLVIAGGNRDNVEKGHIIGMEVNTMEVLRYNSKIYADLHGANIWAIPVEMASEDWATEILAVPK